MPGQASPAYQLLGWEFLCPAVPRGRSASQRVPDTSASARAPLPQGCSGNWPPVAAVLCRCAPVSLCSGVGVCLSCVPRLGAFPAALVPVHGRLCVSGSVVWAGAAREEVGLGWPEPLCRNGLAAAPGAVGGGHRSPRTAAAQAEGRDYQPLAGRRDPPFVWPRGQGPSSWVNARFNCASHCAGPAQSCPEVPASTPFPFRSV